MYNKRIRENNVKITDWRVVSMDEIHTYKIIFYDGLEIPSHNEEMYAQFYLSIFPPEAMITILACLDFAVEDIIAEDALMSEKQALELLVEFYHVEPIEPIQANDMKKLNRVVRTAEINLYNGLLIEINRYWGRNDETGSDHEVKMDTFLPKKPEFKQAIENLRIPLGF